MIFSILLLILQPTRPRLQSHLSETMMYLISIFPHCNFESFFSPGRQQDTRYFVYFLPLRDSVWGCISTYRNSHVQFPTGSQWEYSCGTSFPSWWEAALSCCSSNTLGFRASQLCPLLSSHSFRVCCYRLEGSWEDSACAVDGAMVCDKELCAHISSLDHG